MEVPSGLWRWLVQCGAVASVRAQKNSSSTGMVRVDKQTEAEIASGIVLSKAKNILPNGEDKGMGLLGSILGIN